MEAGKRWGGFRHNHTAAAASEAFFWFFNWWSILSCVARRLIRTDYNRVLQSLGCCGGVHGQLGSCETDTGPLVCFMRLLFCPAEAFRTVSIAMRAGW